jgi:NAD(P)H-dependent FMN reductase
MSKSINPMFVLKIRGEAYSGFAPSFIVWMSLRPAIPWRGTPALPASASPAGFHLRTVRCSLSTVLKELAIRWT